MQRPNSCFVKIYLMYECNGHFPKFTLCKVLTWESVLYSVQVQVRIVKLDLK